MDSFVVSLRDLSTSPATMLVEIRAGDGDEDVLDDEVHAVTKALSQFSRYAGELTVAYPKDANVDVCIGWWGGQDHFEIPQEFFRLIAERGWKVTFDIND